MHGCRCGHRNDPGRACRCPPSDADSYLRRVSGPLLDRIEMRVEMARLPPAELLAATPPESSAAVHGRIVAARRRALQRNGGRPNAFLGGNAVVEACVLDSRARAQLDDLAAARHLSARGVHRLLRVARTIADLDEREAVTDEHVRSAGSLNMPIDDEDSRAAA